MVTLGGMSVFRGAALLFAGGGPISGFDPGLRLVGPGHASGQVPVPVIIFLAFAVARPHRAALHALRPAGLCRRRQSGGGAALRPERASGSLLSVYVIMGFFAGLGAFVLSARLNSAEAVAGTGYELTVIASVVIGGTSLFGGVGTIFGTVIGTILIGVLLNGLVLMNVSSYIQQIIIGVIIVLAVAFDTFRQIAATNGLSAGRKIASASSGARESHETCDHLRRNARRIIERRPRRGSLHTRRVCRGRCRPDERGRREAQRLHRAGSCAPVSCLCFRSGLERHAHPGLRLFATTFRSR